MTDPRRIVRAATQGLRRSRGYRALSNTERASLDQNLQRIDDALCGRRPRSTYRGSGIEDPYAFPMETPADLRGPGGFGPGSPPQSTPPPNGTPAPAPAPPPPPRPTGTEVLGERARRALDAVDFPSFVAQLIQGTFQAIVDATAQQVREYAQLVADLAKSVDDFTRDNVTENQARDYLVGKYPQDLTLALPAPGETTQPQVVPRQDAEESPAWLEEIGLGGESLTPEIVEGPVLQAGRRALGEERMQTLATMVLMGINRIVVNDGQLRAKLQFHARAREKTSAEMVAQSGATQLGIAGRQSTMATAVTTMVSTVDVNAQSDISIKTDLVGEVFVRFRTETFDLNRFADSQAIQLINRHALVRDQPQQPAAAAPGAAAPLPEPAPLPTEPPPPPPPPPTPPEETP